jgi:hypothetical protein
LFCIGAESTLNEHHAAENLRDMPHPRLGGQRLIIDLGPQVVIDIVHIQIV